MTKKIIISNFVVFVFAIGGYILTAKLIEENKTVSCSSLSENECIANKRCDVITGPSSCFGGDDLLSLCTADLTFKRCRTITQEEFKKTNEKEKNCNDFGGTWKSSVKIGGTCTCTNTNKMQDRDYFAYLEKGGSIRFVENAGCISDKALCEKNNGTWKTNFQAEAYTTPYDPFINRPKNIHKEDCKGENYQCTNTNEDYTKGERKNCFYEWDEEKNTCLLAVYDFEEVNTPCIYN
ncbi:MAG: hypothetical protein COX80_01485 [Candidatus Magasanikbacteria bacterium CG_4_10_14_0_2_um_filter_33_14]|uniref:Uncharacterized protein n=1 Tax=Candidatus Magasanikbacteria bacterium CG_4_10_14_0_2_um_filter_33_14 TaxID=1974636 RepID=A0A2M7VBI6_9BACT|nr:MAG: hypothetical protein COX80_01485 [Candidatus Magasanikbacteria bacterium CG_4_10_14_0_2_um_filter_33_14]